MFNSWTCMMVSKGPGLVSEEIRNHLQLAAADLTLRKWDRMKIVGNKSPCEGIIETDWKHHLIGTRGGILFRSQVEGENGEYFINFLLSEEDLKEGAKTLQKQYEENGFDWQASREPFPLAELYEFRDLKRSIGGNTLN
jgi:hypothetical protein